MATVAAHRVQFPYSLDLSRRSSRGVDDRLRKKSEHAARRRWKKSGRRVSTRCRHVPRWPKGRNLFFHRTFRYAFIDWRRAVLSPPASTSSATDVRFGQMTPRSPRPWHDLGIQTPDRNCGPGWRAPSRVFLDLLGGEKKEREDPSLVCPSHLSLPLSLFPLSISINYSPGAALAAQVNAAIMATKRRDRAIFGESAIRTLR